MEQRRGNSACALSAGYEAGSCKRTGDTPETQEELREKLLLKNQAGESSTSEKMMTADDTLSEEGVEDELSGTSLMPKCVFSLQQQLLKLSSLNQLLNRSPVYGSNTKDEVVERRAVPSSVYCDPDIRQPAMHSGEININSCRPSDSKFPGLGNRHVVLQGSRLQTTLDEIVQPLQGSNTISSVSGRNFRRLLDCLSERGFTPGVDQDINPYLTVCTEESGVQYAFELLSLQCEPASRGDSGALLEMEKENNTRKKTHDKDSPGVASTVDSSDYTLNQPPPGPLGETGLMKTLSTAADATPGHSQDNTNTSLPDMLLKRFRKEGRRIDYLSKRDFTLGVDQDNNLDSTVCTEESGIQDAFGLMSLQCEGVSGGDNLQPFMALNDCYDHPKTLDCNSRSCSPAVYTESGENRSEIMSVQSESASGAESDAQMEMETSLTDVKSSATNTWPTVSAGPSTLQLTDLMVQFSERLSDLDPGLELLEDVFSTVNTAGRGENINDKPQPSECEAGGDSDALVQMEAPVTAVSSSVTNTQLTRPHLQLSSDPGWSQRGSSCLPRSHSVPSLSQISSAENETLRPSQSLPDMLLKSSFEEFTPDITVDENDETYRFLCSCPGLYQCSVTGLVFHMEGEGDVVYRIVSWDRRLLAQHHKKPAGPLFDIKCLQQSVCRLHLPHCEIPSTAGCQFLSVAHLNDEGIEFIPPHELTETHVIINISGFSGFGNVKDEDSPPEPVQALVLLFYRPPNYPDLESQLNVLMLPGNVVLQNVLRTRKSLVGDELYIETYPYCDLLPNQEYTLSTCPEDNSVFVQPTTAKFHCDNYDNYFTSFQVDLEKLLKHIKLFLRDTNRHSVWERRVCLSAAGLKKSCRQSALNLPSNEKLFDVRSSFIEGISGPVLKSLLDKLFEIKVLTDSERESADDKHNREDKARFVIDTVRRKGEAASSEMIEFLREVDPFLCEHLGLI